MVIFVVNWPFVCWIKISMSDASRYIAVFDERGREHCGLSGFYCLGSSGHFVGKKSDLKSFLSTFLYPFGIRRWHFKYFVWTVLYCKDFFGLNVQRNNKTAISSYWYMIDIIRLSLQPDILKSTSFCCMSIGACFIFHLQI